MGREEQKKRKDRSTYMHKLLHTCIHVSIFTHTLIVSICDCTSAKLAVGGARLAADSSHPLSSSSQFPTDPSYSLILGRNDPSNKHRLLVNFFSVSYSFCMCSNFTFAELNSDWSDKDVTTPSSSSMRGRDPSIWFWKRVASWTCVVNGSVNTAALRIK